LVIIARSFWRKAIATAATAITFASLYEVTILDSKFAVLRETSAVPAPGARLAFSATAYCRGVITTSGVSARPATSACRKAATA
jgi:hypothetical protein